MLPPWVRPARCGGSRLWGLLLKRMSSPIQCVASARRRCERNELPGAEWWVRLWKITQSPGSSGA